MPQITANPAIDVASEQQPSIFYLDDGAAIFACIGNPNGVIVANKRSIAIDETGTIYTKTTDNVATGWAAVGGGGASADPPAASVQYNNGANAFEGDNRFRFDAPTGTVIIGDTGVAGRALVELFTGNGTNKLVVRANATSTQTIDLWTTIPTANQVLTAISVAGSVVGLGWTTAGGTTINPTDTFLPYRSAASTFADSHLSRTDATATRIASTTNITDAGRLTIAGNGVQIPSRSFYDESLYVSRNSNRPTLQIAGFNTTFNHSPYLVLAKGRGTNASPAAINDGDELGTISFQGYTSTGINNLSEGSAIQVVADGNWGVANGGSEMFFFTSPSGGSSVYRGKWSDKGAFCIGGNPTGDSTDNKLLVGNIGHQTKVTGSIASTASDVNGLDVFGASVMNSDVYFQRWWRGSDGQPRARITQNGVYEQQAGTSASYVSNGVYDINTVAAGNVGTGEDELMARSMSGNTLATNGDHLRFEMCGTFAANANLKRLRVKYGATNIFDSTALALNGGNWHITGMLIRTGATTQKAVVSFVSSNALLPSTATYTTPAETLSSTTNFSSSAEATSNNDIVQEFWILYWYPRET